jgi:hypothetical protein
MKKLFIVSLAAMTLIFSSCRNNSGTPGAAAGSGSPDSAANNGVLPPSAAPENANNSSLADTAYLARDSIKVRDSLKSKK